MSNKTLVSTSGDATFPYSHLAINKNRLKEFNAKNNWFSTSCDYYLSGDTEFQIEIFNPTDKTVGIKVSMNGKEIGSSLLVLYPGQRVWLERDFISNNKFKYIIYEVEKDNPVIEQAIAENGKIKIEFFKEVKREPFVWPTIQPNITWTNYNYSDWNATPTPYSSFDLKSNVSRGMDSDTISACASMDSAVCNIDDSVVYDMCEPLKTKETGIVGRSDNISSQEFRSVAGLDFEYLPFRVENLNIHPISEKMMTAEDTKIRRYCSQCGKKLKPTFKFCPACGTKIE